MIYVTADQIKPQSGISKLNPLSHGPFKIIRKINDVSFEVELPKNWRINNKFHVSHLKLAIQYNDQKFPLRQKETRAEPEVMKDGTIEYEVDKIVDHRTRPRKEYRVRWKGYLSSDDTWKPISNLQIAKELIEEYENSLNDEELNQAKIWQVGRQKWRVKQN